MSGATLKSSLVIPRGDDGSTRHRAERHARALFLFMGGSGLIAQIMILRELLVVFQGNELTISLILANWTLLEALGSFLVSLLRRTANRARVFGVSLFLFCLLTPFAWIAARGLPGWLGTGAQTFTLGQIFLGSILVLAPVALFHGTLFAAGCAMARELTLDTSTDTPRRVYWFEIIGTLCGGIALHFILIPLVSGATIIWLVSVVGLGLTALFMYQSWISRGVSAIACAVYLILIVTGYGTRLAERAAETQFPGQTVAYYGNSPYGNIAVTKLAEQQTVFLNRVPSITTPVPEIAAIEEYVHLPIFYRDGIASCAVLSGGAGGVIAELTKYPKTRVNYTEIDPWLFNVLKRYPTALTREELSYPELRVYHEDCCRFIKETTRTFDIVYLADTLPCDLLTNRLFTVEFHREILKRLNPDGVMICSLPFSLAYPEENLKLAALCLFKTFHSIYPYVTALPGEGKTYILASNSLDFQSVTAERLYANAKRLDPGNMIMIPEQARYFLDEFRLAGLTSEINERAAARVELNRDFHPTVLKYAIAYWQRSTGSGVMFKAWRDRDSLIGRLALLAFITALPAIVFRKRKRHYAIGWTVFSGGFYAMTLQTLMIFAFQAIYGYVFYELGLLVTAFMLGGAIGNRLIPAFGSEPFRAARRIEILAVFVTLALGAFAYVMASGAIAYIPGSRYLFILACAAPGAIVGAQYPVAVRAWSESSGRETPGAIYGLDLAGACLSGWCAGIVLLPSLGLYVTLGFVVALKLAGGAMINVTKP